MRVVSERSPGIYWIVVILIDCYLLLFAWETISIAQRQWRSARNALIEEQQRGVEAPEEQDTALPLSARSAQSLV